MNVEQYQARIHQFTHGRIHRQARRWPDAWLLLLLLTYGRMYRVRDLALMSGQDRDRRMKNDNHYANQDEIEADIAAEEAEADRLEQEHYQDAGEPGH